MKLKTFISYCRTKLFKPFHPIRKPGTPFPKSTSSRCKLQSCHAKRKLKTVACQKQDHYGILRRLRFGCSRSCDFDWRNDFPNFPLLPRIKHENLVILVQASGLQSQCHIRPGMLPRLFEHHHTSKLTQGKVLWPKIQVYRNVVTACLMYIFPFRPLQLVDFCGRLTWPWWIELFVCWMDKLYTILIGGIACGSVTYVVDKF